MRRREAGRQPSQRRCVGWATSLTVAHARANEVGNGADRAFAHPTAPRRGTAGNNPRSSRLHWTRRRPSFMRTRAAARRDLPPNPCACFAIVAVPAHRRQQRGRIGRNAFGPPAAVVRRNVGRAPGTGRRGSRPWSAARLANLLPRSPRGSWRASRERARRRRLRLRKTR
jgi:hypothetical protein